MLLAQYQGVFQMGPLPVTMGLQITSCLDNPASRCGQVRWYFQRRRHGHQKRWYTPNFEISGIFQIGWLSSLVTSIPPNYLLDK